MPTPARLRDARLWLLALLAVALAALAFLLPAMPTPAHLMIYADRRAFLGVPNFFDVASNVPLMLVGLWGACAVTRAGHRAFAHTSEKWPYGVMFASVGLAGIGSTYYHLAPDAARLLWDRLPIAVGFMALVCAVISDRVHPRAALYLLAPFALLGAAAVCYWRWTVVQGSENVVPYAVVQYGGMAAVVVIALLFASRYSHGAYVFGAAAIYAIAKLAEALDGALYALGGIVSGHTLKHLLSALAVLLLLRMVQLRSPA